MDAGVDILAHAPDSPESVDEALFRKMVARRMAIYAGVRQVRSLGGELLFGTDVGYMEDYRTEDEFGALAKCGSTRGTEWTGAVEETLG